MWHASPQRPTYRHRGSTETLPLTDTPSPRTGTVYAKSLGSYTVRDGNATVICSITSLLRRQLVYPIASPQSVRRRVVDTLDIREVDPIAVGDEVEYDLAPDGFGVIRHVLPRRTRFSRLTSGTKPLEQVIVANADLIVPVVSGAQPPPNWALLDRHLVAAESFGIAPLIGVTKLDLADEPTLRRDLEVYSRIGYPHVLTSAMDGRGIDQLRQLLRSKTAVFVGKSGVGKSSLLNALVPGLDIRTNDMSGSTGKGKHTTTTLEMHDLPDGGRVVDTPGMREFGMWALNGTDVAALFPEMRRYLGTCRFGAGCRHRQEPGCAILEAVRSGAIERSRHASYLKLSV
ncbi:ribosome small subunit-dependent GTPase A [Candidatus Poribacteria bacterium]|nr:ribosome small subunit-dependent GTPase A [Candidatus Poribacteria bacterium]